MWGLLLSQPLRIIGTSGIYPDVNLIRRTPTLGRLRFRGWILPDLIPYGGLASVSRGYPPPEDRLGTCYSPVRRCSRPRKAKSPRLACLSPSRIAAASGRINQNWRGESTRSRPCSGTGALAEFHHLPSFRPTHPSRSTSIWGTVDSIYHRLRSTIICSAYSDANAPYPEG